MVKNLQAAAFNLKQFYDYKSYTYKTWQMYVNVNINTHAKCYKISLNH